MKLIVENDVKLIVEKFDNNIKVKKSEEEKEKVIERKKKAEKIIKEDRKKVKTTQKMTPLKFASTPVKVMKSRKKPQMSNFKENKINLIRNYFSPVIKVGKTMEDLKLPQDSTLNSDSIPSTPKLSMTDQVVTGYLNQNETNGDVSFTTQDSPNAIEQQTKQNGTTTNQKIEMG